MAVEDGAVLGLLLGSVSRLECADESSRQALVLSILKLYESLRKSRTTLNVQGAIRNRTMYHMSDQAQRKKRNQTLKDANLIDANEWGWASGPYQQALLGFDGVKNAREAFEQWVKEGGYQEASVGK